MGHEMGQGETSTRSENRMPEIWLKGLLLLFRFCLGGIFIYAGVTKILDPEEFALAIYNYQILPDLLVNPVAVVLPWIEVICGFTLIFGWWIGASSLVLTGLLFIFLFALVITLARGLDISCGCFSSTGEGKISWLYLVRDFSLFAMGAFVFFFHGRESDRYRRETANQ